VIAIVVHGGVSSQKRQEIQRKGVKEAAREGYSRLDRGDSALDAVESAVVNMEDNPVFNAGTGSSLTIEGEAEMDASVMTDDLHCGAVGAIKWVKNPVKVARMVMEKTDHIILAGEGATRFAWMMGFDYYNPVTPDKRRVLLQKVGELSEDHPRLPRMKDYKWRYGYGTVGAVALDRYGRIAVATSTGGLLMNLPGRLGDTPVIGAGTYANTLGGVSAMGHGECIMRVVLAKAIVDRMGIHPVQKAVDEAISMAGDIGGECGAIALDKTGNVGVGFNTEGMAYASVRDGQLEVF
jgi:beta-aspartyl-peptidase (threonine type)